VELRKVTHGARSVVGRGGDLAQHQARKEDFADIAKDIRSSLAGEELPSCIQRLTSDPHVIRLSLAMQSADEPRESTEHHGTNVVIQFPERLKRTLPSGIIFHIDYWA